MELKTSWVDAATLSNADAYITIQATVPKYVKTSDYLWTATGESEPKILALTGMHVVGTVKGHPEMVWATVEHYNNAPDNDYVYTDVNGDNVTVNFSSGHEWLLMSSSGTRATANNPYLAVSDESGSWWFGGAALPTTARSNLTGISK